MEDAGHEGHTLRDFIYEKCPERQICRQLMGMPGLGEGNESDCQWGYFVCSEELDPGVDAHIAL